MRLVWGARLLGCFVSLPLRPPKCSKKNNPTPPTTTTHNAQNKTQTKSYKVARARQRGERVIGEPVTSGLSLDESAMWHPNFDVAASYVMSPPIRSAADRAAVRAALAGGVLSLVATDHAVFNTTQKRAGRGDFRLIPNGVNGIEERMHVVWEEMVNSGAACFFLMLFL